MTFSISKMMNVQWDNSPNIRAVVDISILGSSGEKVADIKDCKLISGDFGTFLASPSRKVSEPYTNKSTGKLVEYVDTVFFHKGIRNELNDLVANAYDPNRAVSVQYPEYAHSYSNAGSTNGAATAPVVDDLGIDSLGLPD
tara:strand:+ start:293 stop:715 length:423 start_codon:yes stop_codon:yes gene_type:complete